MFRVVLDTNVIVRGLISENTASSRVVAAAENRVFVPLLSQPVVREYRDILSGDELTNRFPSLTRRRVETAIARLRFQSDYFRRIRASFDYPRDPLDAKFIELAIDGRATHIVTFDADLLDLPLGKGDAARRFRQRLAFLTVLQPPTFMELLERMRE